MLSWIWFIVDMVDSYVAPVLMLISCSWIVIATCYFIMALHIAFKFNQIKLNLNNYWLSQGATISADQCNHAYQYGTVLTGSIVVPLSGASNEGRLCAGATFAG